MSNQIFVQTSANKYGLIKIQNQLTQNPSEFSETLYTSKYVSSKLPQPQNSGLINTASDRYGPIAKKNLYTNNPSEFANSSKTIVTQKFETLNYCVDKNNVFIKNKSQSLI
jgi:hypothetical protein